MNSARFFFIFFFFPPNSTYVNVPVSLDVPLNHAGAVITMSK